MDANIRIRIGSANNGDYETKTYTDSTFTEAVLALQGTHNDYHNDVSVYVVATYPESFTETLDRRGRTAERYAGQPVFGYEGQVYGRGRHFATHKDAVPSWSSHTADTIEDARLMLNIYDLVTRLAEAANTHPRCAACVQDDVERAAREAEYRAEAESNAAIHAALHAINPGGTEHDGYEAHVHADGEPVSHKDINCSCGHERHNGRVCKPCSKTTPRGAHGTPARCGLTAKKEATA